MPKRKLPMGYGKPGKGKLTATKGGTKVPSQLGSPPGNFGS